MTVSHCELRVVAQSAFVSKRIPPAAATGIQTSMSPRSKPVNPRGATPTMVNFPVPSSIALPTASARPPKWRCQNP